MEKKSLFIGILIGIVSLIAIFTITVAIACSVNGITFMEQVVRWFAPNFELVKKVVTPAV